MLNIMNPETAPEEVNDTDHEVFLNILNSLRNRILNISRCFQGKTFQTLKEEVHELLQRSIVSSESNSAIIVGAPGYGKSILVENVLKELKNKNVITKDTAKVVQLNGLIHTDDRIALKGISKQLNLQDQVQDEKTGSFQDNLMFLLDSLKEDNKQQMCVVFILDHFNLFCDHKNQILLYNLLDIAQAAKAPICVLGMTSCIDIMDLLEKRVLSRFSHRILHLIEPPSVDNRVELFKEILTLDVSDLQNVDPLYIQVWNVRIEDLATSSEVRKTLETHLAIDASHARFRTDLFEVLTKISLYKPYLTADDIRDVFTEKDWLVVMVSKLPLLEMALIIAMKHRTINYEREPFNFEMIYAQLLKFTNTHPTNLVTTKSVVLKMFQRLHELEIILPDKAILGNSFGKVPYQFQLFNLNLTLDKINEAVKLNEELGTEIRMWANSSLH